MKDIFECEPNPHDPFDGIDLLYGIEDMTGGKVLDFFRQLATQKGIDAQQSYARLCSMLLFPHCVDTYALELMVELHMRQPKRGGSSWELATKEIDACIAYLDTVSECTTLAVPVLIEDEMGSFIAWNIEASGKMQLYSGMFLGRLFLYREFCDDPSAIADIDDLVQYYTQIKSGLPTDNRGEQ